MKSGILLPSWMRSAATAASIGVLSAAATQGARADDPARLLKAMADYTAAQKSISASFDSDIEIITPELQKIQFTSSGQVQLSRPDKLRATRTGGYRDVESCSTARLLPARTTRTARTMPRSSPPAPPRN